MTVAYRGLGALVTGTTSPLTPDIDAIGAAVDDLVFIIAANYKTNSPDSITSTGYTQDAQATNTTPAPDLWATLLRRFFVAGDADPSVANGSTPSNGWGTFCFGISGVDPTTPNDVATVTSTGQGASPIPTGLTTATDGTLVLSIIVSTANAVGGITVSATDQGFTTIASGGSYVNTTRALGFAVTYKIIPTAGTAVTCPTYSQGVKDWIGITVALRPAPLSSPLDSAWGAGGTFWHLYNQPADQVSRRQEPVQRLPAGLPPSIPNADPTLGGLSAAYQTSYRRPDGNLAEWQQRTAIRNPTPSVDKDPTLGGLAAIYQTTARRPDPNVSWWQQRQAITNPTPDADVTLGGVAPAYATSHRRPEPDRSRWQQQQRIQFQGVAANPLVSPLDSAWQAGARYWHLYNQATDQAPNSRTWWPQQRIVVQPVTTENIDPSLGGMSRTYQINWWPDSNRSDWQQRTAITNPTPDADVTLGGGVAQSYSTSHRRPDPNRATWQQRQAVTNPTPNADLTQGGGVPQSYQTAHRRPDPARPTWQQRQAVTNPIPDADLTQGGGVPQCYQTSHRRPDSNWFLPWAQRQAVTNPTPDADVTLGGLPRSYSTSHRRFDPSRPQTSQSYAVPDQPVSAAVSWVPFPLTPPPSRTWQQWLQRSATVNQGVDAIPAAVTRLIPFPTSTWHPWAQPDRRQGPTPDADLTLGGVPQSYSAGHRRQDPNLSSWQQRQAVTNPTPDADLTLGGVPSCYHTSHRRPGHHRVWWHQRVATIDVGSPQPVSIHGTGRAFVSAGQGSARVGGPAGSAEVTGSTSSAVVAAKKKSARVSGPGSSAQVSD